MGTMSEPILSVARGGSEPPIGSSFTMRLFRVSVKQKVYSTVRLRRGPTSSGWWLLVDFLEILRSENAQGGLTDITTFVRMTWIPQM